MKLRLPLTRVFSGHSYSLLSLLTLAILLGVGFFSLLPSQEARAATSSYINFQARLQTAAGAIVADGTYNIEFKLYNASSSTGSSQGSCTGDTNCLWTETRTGGNVVTVKNGYVTVNLGSVTALPNIDWSQQLWLTMRVGGTGTPSWDPEMNPRLQMTATPYAFAAGKLQTTSGSLTSTLSIAAPTVGNQTFTIPDQGAAGSYTLLTSAAAAGSYIQNTTSPQTANFNITGNGTVGGILAANGSTSGDFNLKAINNNSNGYGIYGFANNNDASHDVLRLDGSGGTVFSVKSNGNVSAGSLGASTVNSTSGYYVNGVPLASTHLSDTANIARLNQTQIFTGGNTFTGQVLIKNSNSDMFQVQNAGGTPVLDVDTTTNKVTLQSLSDAATLGSELFGSSAFQASTGWTSISGTGAASTATHTNGGGTTAVTTNFAPTAGLLYQISYTVSGMTGGTITSNIGGTAAGSTLATNATQVDVVRAGTTATLRFTPSTDFNGTITGVSVKVLTAATGSVLALNSSDGSPAIEFRPSLSGGNSMAVGLGALYSNITGTYNTAIGSSALYSNISGNNNTAIGATALANNVSGGNNTALGVNALTSNASGSANVALGVSALRLNSTGSANVAAGYLSLYNNLSGNYNISLGFQSLYNNFGGSDNVSSGRSSMLNNTNGNNNVASGYQSLTNNTTGSFNVGLGSSAGFFNTTGSYNTYVGPFAGGNDNGFQNAAGISNSSALGQSAVVQQSGSLVLGAGSSANFTLVGIGTPQPDNVLSVSPYKYDSGPTVTATQSGTTLTASSGVFTSDMVGLQVIFGTGGTKEKITAYTSATQVTVSVSQTISPGQSFRVQYPGLQVDTTGEVGIGTTTPGAQLQVVTPVNTATAFNVQNSSGSNVLNVDTTNNRTTLTSLGDGASLGAELFTTSYSFPVTAGWTSISGTGSTAGATHTSGGGTTALQPTPAMTVVAGNSYQVTFTITSGTTGSITPTMGGFGGVAVYNNTTETQIMVPSTTGNLTFVPTTDFNGRISAVSVKLLTLAQNVVLNLAVAGGSVGNQILASSTASFNTGVGGAVMGSNISGTYDSAFGRGALNSNTTGSYNTAMGALALNSNTIGSYNTASGWGAGSKITSGSDNTATGAQALYNTTSGIRNTAFGSNAGQSNVGNNNTFLGFNSGASNTTGTQNSFLGANAGASDSGFGAATGLTHATAVGYNALAQQSYTLTLGGTGAAYWDKIGIGTPQADNVLSVSPYMYDSGTGTTATQSGTTLTASSSVFTAAMVGNQVIFGAGGTKETITAFTSGTQVTVSVSQTISPGQSFRVQYPGLQVTTAGKIGINTLNPSGLFQINTPVANTAAFTVQNAASGNEFNIDTSAHLVSVGSSTTDTTAILLVLDSYSTAADPTGVNGAMYYNTATNSFRCRMNGVWRACNGGLVNSATAVSTAVTAVGPQLFAGGTNNSYTVLANDCQTGVTYRVVASGTLTLASTVGSTNPIKFAVNEDNTSTPLAYNTTAIDMVGMAAGTYGWSMTVQIVCISTTNIEVQGVVTLQTNAGTSTTPIYSYSGSGASTYNPGAISMPMSNTAQKTSWSTAAHTLYGSPNFTNTTGTPSVTQRQFIVERMGP